MSTISTNNGSSGKLSPMITVVCGKDTASTRFPAEKWESLVPYVKTKSLNFFL